MSGISSDDVLDIEIYFAETGDACAQGNADKPAASPAFARSEPLVVLQGADVDEQHRRMKVCTRPR